MEVRDYFGKEYFGSFCIILVFAWEVCKYAPGPTIAVVEPYLSYTELGRLDPRVYLGALYLT
jgi:hypothetical protein